MPTHHRLAGTMPSDGPSGWNSTEVMYAPGKILRCGGGWSAVAEHGGPKIPGKNAAAVIDISVATPSYTKMPSMPKNLISATSTVLANGDVVVTGGSAVDNELTGMNTDALLWKPGIGGWTRVLNQPPALRACTTPSLCSCPTARS